ncbi:XopX family type III secretion system effector [Xanthomonas oryzae]|uniref:XopX family type III secretion system effector n=1 Tax=Xanthomonas oryzae TaxID=347 RepID=UPI000949DB4C|nr:XopX family type III secretion system effector [Xanthomonas oryzae]OLK22976.1 type III secretion system effector protein [Xanthomonas oryzae pv. oryzae]OLK43124.1 type III secretion system effector protein [Xanthomonas oryzae pv. oryzae]UXW31185.1 type III secretion system effector protein [Xanthomonas oryzae pv. oryzae]UZF12361.1 type III secretion system effector protein [Xanthomonas oryzae pv. oryzae]
MRIQPRQIEESSSPSATSHEQTHLDTGVAGQTSASPPQTPVAAPLAALSPRRRASTSAPATASHATVAEASSNETAPAATPAPSTETGLLARARSALATGTQHAITGLSQAAHGLWSISDLRTMLESQAHDPAFLQMVRQLDQEQAAPHSLARLSAAITQLRGAISNPENGLEERFRNAFLSDIKAVEDALHPLEHGTPATGRALKALLNLANAWPLLVPSPFMANQAKTFSYSLALAARGVLMLSASALRSTADGLPIPLIGGGQFGRDANELHLYAYLLNGLFLPLEITKKAGNEAVRHQAEAVENNMGFGAAAATACAAIMVTPFLWSSISALGNRARDQASRLHASAAHQLGFTNYAQRTRAGMTPGQISAELRTQLDQIAAVLLDGRDAFQQVRRDFTGPGQGHELTRTLNAQCTQLLETVDRCCQRLSTVLQHGQGQGPGPGRSESIPRQLSNNDIASKLSLALLGTAVSGSAIYLIQPDRIGTVDTLADTAVVTTVMLQSAFNKNANRQDTMERFKAMCGGSMVIAMALTAEKLAKTFADRSLIEASSASPYYAGAIMSLMAMTMPGPVANATESAMNWGGRQISRLFTGPDGRQLATTVASTPEELQETTHRTLQYLLQLSPQHLQAYEEHLAPDAALQAIQDASAAARPNTSGVTITEIEEDGSVAVPIAATSQNSPPHLSTSDDATADRPSTLH